MSDGENNDEQPYSLYHVDEPHKVRSIHEHLGVFPLRRADPYRAMDFLRAILQPTINEKMIEVMNDYVEVVREASENTKKNFSREPFENNTFDPEYLVLKFFEDAFDISKKKFQESIRVTPPDVYADKPEQLKTTTLPQYPLLQQPLLTTQQPNLRPSMLGKRRADSPDLYNKRLNLVHQSPRRSLSPGRPVIKKGSRAGTPVGSSKKCSTTYKPIKNDAKRKIENWDPQALTTETEFVMGTKANKALGLGATRGRIYMKHPELFKYSGDHEDKKWMVKNNCMQATGGKNTFIMIAEDVMTLYRNEYKDCHGTKMDELKFFHLPPFVLRKMRSAMENDKMLRRNGQGATGRPPAGCPSLQQFSGRNDKKQTTKSAAQQQQQHITPQQEYMTSQQEQTRNNLRALVMTSQHHQQLMSGTTSSTNVVVQSAATGGVNTATPAVVVDHYSDSTSDLELNSFDDE